MVRAETTAPMLRSPSARGLLGATAALVALLAACSRESVLPRFPQVEQAQETMHGGGERFRDHRTCVGSSTTVQGLIQCMDAAHWHFVAHGGVYPEPECWEARDRDELERVGPQCFVRAPEHP
jgi:hypothetical protein